MSQTSSWPQTEMANPLETSNERPEALNDIYVFKNLEVGHHFYQEQWKWTWLFFSLLTAPGESWYSPFIHHSSEQAKATTMPCDQAWPIRAWQLAATAIGSKPACGLATIRDWL